MNKLKASNTISDNKIKVALVEDNIVNRNTFLQKMQFEDAIEIINISNNGHEFLEFVKGLPEHQLPSVVFMDIEMPKLNGIETIQLAKALHPDMQFIVLTVFEDDDTIFAAVQAGATGYLLKHESQQTLSNAIQEILEFGGAPMTPAIARKTLRLLGKTQSIEKDAVEGGLNNLLSDREIVILKHMVNGYDAKRIASIINISTLTVRKHISNIYNKLHVNSKAQVISMAHKNKWV